MQGRVVVGIELVGDEEGVSFGVAEALNLHRGRNGRRWSARFGTSQE